MTVNKIKQGCSLTHGREGAKVIHLGHKGDNHMWRTVRMLRPVP